MRYQNNTSRSSYHLLVTEKNHYHITEWSGMVTVSVQEGGETSLDISFIDQSIVKELEVQPLGYAEPAIAIDGIEVAIF